MIYACWQCLHGVFGIDTVLIIQSYFGTMFTSLSDLVTALGELRIKHVSIDRYDGFMRKKEDEMTKTEVVVESKDYDIQMNHLGFSYGEEPIFSDYSVRILPNTLTALFVDQADVEKVRSFICCCGLRNRILERFASEETRSGVIRRRRTQDW